MVRMDFDIPGDDLTRVESSLETLKYLIDHQATIILVGHKGRPEGVVVEELSLKSLVKPLGKMFGREILFVEDFKNFDFGNAEVFLLENLRFDKRESLDPSQDTGAEEFAKKLAGLADFYVNEAFAVSHRAHASIVGIPKFLPHAAGFRLVQEIEHLNRVIQNPQRPLVFLISGIKEDKLKMIEKIKHLADKILVAGRLPEYFEKSSKSKTQMTNEEKVLVAQLNSDKEDITIHSIEKFEEEIDKAKTIVLAGVIGKYEDEGQRLGTKRVFEAVANSSAYKVAGGGDTEAALTIFDLTDKFDWISVGGGAMLEFLAKGTSPGTEALQG